MLEDPEPGSQLPGGFVSFLLVDDHDIHSRNILCISDHGRHCIEAGDFDQLNHDSREKCAFSISLVSIPLSYDSHCIPSQIYLCEFQVHYDTANTQSVFLEILYPYDIQYNQFLRACHLKYKNSYDQNYSIGLRHRDKPGNQIRIGPDDRSLIADPG